MGKTSIEWTEITANPIRARWKDHNRFRSGHYCEKVSRGCANCYSSEMQPRFGMPKFQDARGDENIEHFLDPKTLHEVLGQREPAQVFWCSMTDMFGRWVPNEWIAACFGVMAATPHLTHQILTKRADRLPEWFEWARSDPDGPGAFVAYMTCVTEASKALYPDDEDARDAFDASLLTDKMMEDDKAPVPWPLPNVHLGVSCEDQGQADKRIPDLLRTPAAVRWISAEPLLGDIVLREQWMLGRFIECLDENRGDEIDPCIGCDGIPRTGQKGGDPCGAVRGPKIDWVVPGGESGRRARTCQLDWIRHIVLQCQDYHTPVLVKQLGADPREGEQLVQISTKKGGDINDFPKDLQIREYPR